MDSLYKRLGGKEVIDSAVKLFYKKVLADEVLAPFFSGVDMVKQESQQKMFLSMVFGGPQAYRGQNLRQAHVHLVSDAGLNDEHYNRLCDHLRSTLTVLSASKTDIDSVMDLVEGVRDDVLNR